jgi:hypothetical protein
MTGERDQYQTKHGNIDRFPGPKAHKAYDFPKRNHADSLKYFGPGMLPRYFDPHNTGIDIGIYLYRYKYTIPVSTALMITYHLSVSQ